jgi:hypothetical protein
MHVSDVLVNVKGTATRTLTKWSTRIAFITAVVVRSKSCTLEKRCIISSSLEVDALYQWYKTQWSGRSTIVGSHLNLGNYSCIVNYHSNKRGVHFP